MEKQLAILERFAAWARKLPMNLPDRAHGGIDGLTVGDYRFALRIFDDPDRTPYSVALALAPFARASEGMPVKAREWSFGTTNLTYGDFMDARIHSQAH